MNVLLTCDSCWWDTDGEHFNGVIGSHSACVRCGATPGALNVLDEKAHDPHIKSGAMEFSTCISLELHPTWIWDTNRFYATLGVDVRASKEEIRRAYQDLDGPSSVRLTEIVRVLVNDELRRRYDTTGIGHFFYDSVIDAMVRRHETEEMSRAIREGRATVGADGLTRILEESDEVVVDRAEPDGQDALSHPRRTIWPWGYYVWKTGSRSTWRLAEWQGALAKAVTERGEKLRLTPGLIGSIEEPFWIERIGYRTVVFLADDEQPTAELAQQAVASLCNPRTVRTA